MGYGLSSTLTIIATVADNTSATGIPGIILPLYVDPGGEDWANVLAVALQHPTVPIIVIVNPDNGPVPASQASNYISAMSNILSQCPNVYFLGYCDTNSEISLYPVAQVEGYVNQYLTWGKNLFYGMFFDDYDFVNTSYTAALGSLCESLGLYSIGNPGTSLPTPTYEGEFSNWCIYENGGAKQVAASYFNQQGLPATQMCFISYGFSSFPPASWVQSISTSVQWLNIGSDAGGSDGPYGVTGQSTLWLQDTAAALSAIIPVVPPVSPPPVVVPPPPVIVVPPPSPPVLPPPSPPSSPPSPPVIPPPVVVPPVSPPPIVVPPPPPPVVVPPPVSPPVVVPPPVLPPPPPPSILLTLAVATQDTKGGTLSGYAIAVSPTSVKGKTVTQYSSASFPIQPNTTYSVTADSYGAWQFDYWQDTKSTKATRSVKVTDSSISLVAVYYDRATNRMGHMVEMAELAVEDVVADVEKM